MERLLGPNSRVLNKCPTNKCDAYPQVLQSGAGVAAKRVDIAYVDNRVGTLTRYADLSGTQLVATSTFSYAGSQISGISHTQGSTVLATLGYTYNAAGLVSSVTTDTNTASYSYDATGQLVGVDNSTLPDEGHTYDANGNRTGTGYAVGAGNRQLSDPRFSYTYDDEGNRTAKVDAITGERTEYVWDARNRLDEVKIETSSGAVVKDVDYIYDALNQKIGKIVKNGSGVIVGEEHYGVEARTASRSVPVAGMLSQATLDQVSVVTGANGAVTERYVYGPAVDQVLAVDSVGSQVLWMLSDQQGSVRTVISSAGTKLKTVEYDGFGNVVSDSAPTVAVRFLYTGREWDADTQLQNNRARWFDPATGRWLSNDPMGFAAGDVNLQRYVGNGAPNATDPSGLEDPTFEDVNTAHLQARGIYWQAFGYQHANSWGLILQKKPLFTDDVGFAKLVIQYMEHAKKIEILQLPRVARYFFPSESNVGMTGKWLFTHSDTPAAVKAIEERAKTLLTKENYAEWQLDERALAMAIMQYEYEAKNPRAIRFVGGILWAGVKTIGGSFEAIAYFERIPAGLYDLATDSVTQKKVFDAIVAKLSDTSAENIGELVVEIPLLVTGTVGTVKGVAKAASYAGKLVIKIPKAVVDVLKAQYKNGTLTAESFALTGVKSQSNVEGMFGKLFGGGKNRAGFLTAEEIKAISRGLREHTNETYQIIPVGKDAPPWLKKLMDGRSAAHASPEAVAKLIADGILDPIWAGQGVILVPEGSTLGEVLHEMLHALDRFKNPKWFTDPNTHALDKEISVIKSLLDKNNLWSYLTVEERAAQISAAEYAIRKNVNLLDKGLIIENNLKSLIQQMKKRLNDRTVLLP